VQDDDAWPATESLDDPAVRRGLIPDVVERDVRPAAAPSRASADDVDVDPLRQRRQEERAVVSDPRPLRW
jgi:hypothetical protein